MVGLETDMRVASVFLAVRTASGDQAAVLQQTQRSVVHARLTRAEHRHTEQTEETEAELFNPSLCVASFLFSSSPSFFFSSLSFSLFSSPYRFTMAKAKARYVTLLVPVASFLVY